ncbi:MAG TPA: hypothetical protein VN256_13025 [Pyrinomonadaceae bacterium]|nr:hypothetical protein [Pyrinomonadaceae bacterium]
MNNVGVAFKDGGMKGFILFPSWGKAMGFIFALERRERFDPKGRWAHVVN